VDKNVRNPEGFRRLRTRNIVVGIAHLVQAILMLALSNALAFPVVAGFLTTDPVLDRGDGVPQKLFEIPIGPAVALFLFLAAFDHLLVAAPRIRPWYERKLAEGINPARWIEYSVSASIMVVLIAMFTGIRDVAALLGLFGANTSMILFGWLMERHQSPGRADWSAFWFGCIAGAVPWIAIGWYTIGGASPPTFVYVIIFTQLLLFSVFAVNQALQYAQVGKWRSYVYGESTYILLSLVAKSLLAWLIFANVLRS
jgi:MFS family permease